MNWIGQFLLWFHAASAIVWIGGIFFMMAVAVPLAGPPVAGALGKKFSGIADWCIASLVITGAAAVFFEGYFYAPVQPLPLVKLLMAMVMISVHYYRGKVLGPEISKAGDAQTARLKRLSANLAWFNLALGFIVVFVSMVLAKS